MDEQGRIHNTVKPASETSKPPVTPAAEQQTDDFLTEEEFQKKLAKDKEDNPPFFTWIDAQGRLQSQEIPQLNIEVEELSQLQSADHSLLPPLRVAANIRDSGCCLRYQHIFKDTIPEYKSVLFSQVQLSVPFKTRSGDKAAWYFRLPESSLLSSERSSEKSLPEPRRLTLHLRDNDGLQGPAPVALIALDKQLQPLYFIPQLITQSYLSTWRSSAYQESLINILDADVSAFIIYFPQSAPASVSLQVEWVYGKTSD